MARLRDMAKGDHAYCHKILPLLNDQQLPIAIGILPFGEEGRALAAAREYAKKQGVEDPKSGNPLYERAIALHTVFLSCFDPDVLPNRVRTFETIQEIEDTLDHDRVAMLFQWQRTWQKEIAPSPKGMTPQEYLKMVVQTAEAEEDEEIPLSFLPPKQQTALWRFTCALCMSLLQLRSPSGSRLPADEETLIASLTLTQLERVKTMLLQYSVQSPPGQAEQSPAQAAPESVLLEKKSS